MYTTAYEKFLTIFDMMLTHLKHIEMEITNMGVHLNPLPLCLTFFFFIFRGELQLAQVEDIVEKVVFLEGNCSHPCIVRLPNFEGVCG